MTSLVREPDVLHCKSPKDGRAPKIQRAPVSTNPESRITNPGH